VGLPEPPQLADGLRDFTENFGLSTHERLVIDVLSKEVRRLGPSRPDVT
jgi:hypothetical protein